jgi:hypothetical protein
MRDIYNIENEDAIREYLGLDAEWCKDYFNQWKPSIKKALTKAKELGCEYILSCDYGIYAPDNSEFICDIEGIILYRDKGEE